MGSRRLCAVVIAMVLALMLAACSQTPAPAPESKAASSGGSGGGAAQPAAASSSGQKAPAKVGEQVTSGEWTLTVDKVSRSAEAGGAKAGSGKEILVVEMTAVRKGKDEGTGPAYFKLKDSSGATIQAAPTGTPDFIFSMQQPVKADTPTKIKIAYEVPAGANGLTITFQPFIDGGPSQPVEIKLD